MIVTTSSAVPQRITRDRCAGSCVNRERVQSAARILRLRLRDPLLRNRYRYLEPPRRVRLAPTSKNVRTLPLSVSESAPRVPRLAAARAVFDPGPTQDATAGLAAPRATADSSGWARPASNRDPAIAGAPEASEVTVSAHVGHRGFLRVSRECLLIFGPTAGETMTEPAPTRWTLADGRDLLFFALPGHTPAPVPDRRPLPRDPQSVAGVAIRPPDRPVGDHRGAASRPHLQAGCRSVSAVSRPLRTDQ